ncbi:MAG: lipoprotein insertase outer membrane protein LolB [Pseudomonadota bacterium]
MRLRSAALLLIALLGGCASLPDSRPTDPAAVDAAWTERQQQLAGLPGFQLNGRVAIKGGGLSGALRWRQEGETFDLRIAGPFGAGALSMQGTPANVAIKGKDIDLVTSEPRQVLAARTGWRLPLDALRWWVLGLPAPLSDEAEAARIVLDAEGRPERIQQGDWTLRYSDYRSETMPAMPYRIEAVQPTASGEWMATVIIEAMVLSP